ncbi:MAG: T9SS type A sorting domain-containing protein, partial [Bacteroidales bacterium]
ENIPASGGEGEGSGGSVSYSVGQLFWHTHDGNNISVAEGVQQPYEISVVTAIDEADDILLAIMAYPNPTADFLTLELKNFEPSSFQYQLYDIQGKLWQSEKITGNHTHIDVSFLVPGTYFLKVTQENKDFKTFKIIKTQ